MNGIAPNGTELQVRLNQPEMALALNRLLDRIDTLEQAVSTLTATLGQAPGFIAMAGDILDEGYRKAAASGTNLEERAMSGLALLNRLTEPRLVAQLEQLLALATQAPGLLAMAGDMVDDAYRSAANAGVDVELMLRKGATAAVKFSEVVASDSFDTLLESGMIEPNTLEILGSLGKALRVSRAAPPKPVGPLRALNALRDPDVQKALGFLLSFAKAFGKTL